MPFTSPDPIAPRLTPLRAAALVLAAALVAAGIALAAEAPRRPSAPQTFVIPPGTAARVRAGASVDDVMPQTVATGVGVPLVIENQDTENHAFGPFALAPGQSWRRQFAVAGTYGFTCSIYPTAGFAIDVAPAAGLGLAEGLRRAWLAAWALLGVAVAAAVAERVAGNAPLGMLPDERHVADQPSALAGAWAGATVGLVPLSWAAASRVADWGPVLSSRTTGWQLGAASLAVVGVLGLTHLRTDARSGLSRLAMPAVLIVATWWALTPVIGASGSWRAALAVIGAGSLVAAMGARRRPGGSAVGARLALAGGILLLGGLPLPANTPPITAALALPALVAAVGVAALGWLGGRRLGIGDDRGGLVRAAAGLVALAQLVVLWGALVAHVDAMALPLDGNPVRASASSLARGASIWATDCAACHATTAELAVRVRAADDRALLRLLTEGRGAMPGFAYRLDITARGDVLNFLRDASAAADGTDGAGESVPPSAP